MTVISSKLKDNDPIAENRIDQLGNRYLIPSKLMITWMDDVTEKLESLNPFENTDSELRTTVAATLSRIEDIKQSVCDQVSAVDSFARVLANAFNNNPWLFFDVSVQSANYTTKGTEGVIAVSNITVFLNDNPQDGERAIIKRATTAGNVLIDPQSKTIDGDDDYSMVINYEGIQCIYSLEQDQWYKI